MTVLGSANSLRGGRNLPSLDIRAPNGSGINTGTA